ncbi:glycosyltransferase family protein [Paenibacillus sp. strain BS8-2]
MDRLLNVLVLVKRFAETYPKHQHKFDMIAAIERVANVHYWSKDGDIREIVARLPVKPDVIFHYDFEWRHAFAPRITHLDKIDILKVCYVLDIHYDPAGRRSYFDRIAKPDIIMSASKYPFLDTFPDTESRFRWLPFGVNPAMITDHGLPKDTPYSLFGLMDPQYPFRNSVLKAMSREEGFVHYRHPGHRTASRPGLLVQDTYAQAINRSMMSFTCGSVLRIPVAKFFEIPGCRTLMLAESNPDIEELGFIDGDNFVACSRSNIAELARKYRNDDAARDAIAQNGYAMIHQAHTNEIRAKQFVAYAHEALS